MLNLKSDIEILNYLKKDILFTNAIVEIERIMPELDLDIYLALLNSVISQQLNTKVARIIWNRFLDLYVDRYPEPEILLDTNHDILRSIGLSNNKANYIKNVAKFSLDNDLSFEALNEKPDEEIIDFLTEVKGVGKWTAQMILMFPMDRPNVFPIDDLGIQNGMKKIYRINLEKKEMKKRIYTISENWHPYKTLACKYIWKINT